MGNILRTPEKNFSELANYSFEPNYYFWNEVRVHYIDEGPREGPIMLLLHGMPTWGYLYRDIIPTLVAQGYRCIAPDHVGFGRSDKPTEPSFYSIARHTEVLSGLISTLGLKNITLVCQDWGGPIGLAQAVYMEERFSRLVIMNTWLHHPEYEYSEAIVKWNKNWQKGGLFNIDKPDIAALLLISAGIVAPKLGIAWILNGEKPIIDSEASAMFEGFQAPYLNMPADAFNGLRAFPLSICHYDLDRGNGTAQTYFFKKLLGWSKPVHFIWGGADDIFTENWGKKWAGLMKGTFKSIPEAGHFLQNTHGKAIVEILLNRISEE